MPIDLANPVNRNHPLNRGLVSWWLPMPNNSGGDTLFDIAGRNHLTRSGSAYWSSKQVFGTASSSGAFTYTKPSGSSWFGAGCTIAWWAKPNSIGGDQQVFRLGGGTDAGTHWNYFRTGGAVRMDDFITSGFGNFNTLDTATTFSNGQKVWYAYTYDGTTQRVYVSGVQNNSATVSDGFAGAEPTDFGLLGQPDQSQPLNGECYGAWTYSRALSASEIWDLYDQSLRGYPDLLNYYSPTARLFLASQAAAVTSSPPFPQLRASQRANLRR